jgi:hypothetical protein
VRGQSDHSLRLLASVSQVEHQTPGMDDTQPSALAPSSRLLFAEERSCPRNAGANIEVSTRVLPGRRAHDAVPRMGAIVSHPPGSLAVMMRHRRALEAILTSQDYDADRAERYGWVARAVPDAELDDVVNDVAARVASFDKAAVLGAKAQINRVTLPPEADLRASWAGVLAIGYVAGIPGTRAAARQGDRRARSRRDRAKPGRLRRPPQPAGIVTRSSPPAANSPDAAVTYGARGTGPTT